MFTLHNGDCLQYMRSMQSESVDCIITDPPYGINIKTGFNGDDKSISYDDGFSVMFFLDEYVKQWNRILKPNSAIYVFTRYDVMPYWWIRMKGCFDMKNCIVWSKGGGGTGDLKGNYIGTHEMILFGAKGRHILSGKRESNVWEYSKCKPDLHPMQKPVDLLSNIIFHSTKEGDVIFDPFSGSGQTGKAALMNGRSFIGCEIDERYYRLAQSGLEGIEPSTPSNKACTRQGQVAPQYEYENVRRKVYEGNEGSLVFVPVCPKCGRFVKSDETVLVNGFGELKEAPNATCSKCGRVEMPYEGYLCEDYEA